MLSLSHQLAMLFTDTFLFLLFLYVMHSKLKKPIEFDILQCKSLGEL
jgi:hypothetical protein